MENTSQTNNGRNKVQDLIEYLLKIKSDDTGERRRGRILAIFIMMLSVLLIYIIIENSLYAILYKSAEYTGYVVQDLFTSLAAYIFWRLNRSGKTMISAYIFFFFLIIFASLYTSPEYFEYLMVFFTLPVMISSFVLEPRCSFLFASLTVAAYAALSLAAGYVWQYNLSAALSLFAVAGTSWVISSQLESTIHKNQALFTELRDSNQKISDAYETTLEGWSHALELRDKETEGHTRRVTELTVQIARQMGLPEERILHIRRGALLHDIGKMGVPDEILYKPGPLTEEEWKAMRQHPQFAYDLISRIDYLHPALDIPYCHHEKWDGSGYPRGLKGEEIPLEARIFAVVDVYDALTSARPYRGAWSKERALEYIQKESGTHFEPRIVEFFIYEINKETELIS